MSAKTRDGENLVPQNADPASIQLNNGGQDLRRGGKATGLVSGGLMGREGEAETAFCVSGLPATAPLHHLGATRQARGSVAASQAVT